MIFGYTTEEVANGLRSLSDAINASNAAVTMSLYDSMRCNCDRENGGFLASVPEPCRPVSPAYLGVCEVYHEPTEKQVVDYCHKRGLVIVEEELFQRMKATFAQLPKEGEWIFSRGDGKTCVDGWTCSACGNSFHTNVPYFEEFHYSKCERVEQKTKTLSGCMFARFEDVLDEICGMWNRRANDEDH